MGKGFEEGMDALLSIFEITVELEAVCKISHDVSFWITSTKSGISVIGWQLRLNKVSG